MGPNRQPTTIHLNHSFLEQQYVLQLEDDALQSPPHQFISFQWKQGGGWVGVGVS